MSSDVEQKQKFLMDEIMRKGYDSDDFTNWMDSKKEKGSQCFHQGCYLERWTMEELVKVVQEYQESHMLNNPRGCASPQSPEKSPSLVSDKADYSSIHSQSIPVPNTSNLGNFLPPAN